MKPFPMILGMSLIMLCTLIVSAQNVKTDYDKAYDFNILKTFDFKSQTRAANDPLATNSLADKRIKNALENQLTLNGFKRETAQDPDFFIAYYAGLKERIDVRTLNYGRPRRFGMDIWTDHYVEGTVMVDFIDAKTNQLVWRGYATDTVDPDKNEKKINKGAEKLIKEFRKDAGRKK